MFNIINILNLVFGSLYFLSLVTATSFLLKIFIILVLIKKGTNSSERSYSWFFLILILIGTLVSDFAWLLKLMQSLFFNNLDYRIITFWIRIAWGFTIIQYHGFTLFLESLITREYIFGYRQKIFLFLSTILFSFFVGLAFFDIDCSNPLNKPWIEFTMQQITSLYALFPLTLSTLFITIRKLKQTTLPRILKKQFILLLQVIIAPYWIFDFLQIYPFGFSPTWITNSYAFTSISNILLTFAIYFCARKIMGLRFLNFENHVQTKVARFSFMDDFKNTLEQLSYVNNIDELRHITQSFFKEAFGIPLGKTTLQIRVLDANSTEPIQYDITANCVETFLGTQEQNVLEYIRQQKILIYDEVAFSNFYENHSAGNAIITFLDTLNADLFLPIYEKNNLVAYVIIDRYARFDQFYSSVERDEMLVFSSYMGNIIHLLQNKMLENLTQHTKEIQEELYRKHQEISQYKESIRSFLRTKKQQHVGIIFYKNRRFSYGNQTAKELIHVNINVLVGHPISKALKHIAHSVEQYKSPQTIFIKDIHGNPLVLAAVPHLENQQVIIMVHHPEVSDILKKQIDLLQDPSEWDYVLYLETTESGKLINQLIPGSGTALLKFKINLLKTALSRKAILLDMPEQDALSAVELLHHISLRDNLHTLDLQQPVTTTDIAIELFGINPIFGIKHENQPLLEILDRTGTLYIKNIEYLDQETQKHLAEFIRYGFFRSFKSDQKISSNVRIICSSNKDLQLLVQERKFSKDLLNELKQTTVSMPSLVTLPEDELKDLAQGFSEQAIKTQALKSILTLSERDKEKIANIRPTSLQELKTKVQHMLLKKSHKNNIYEETEFDPAYQITDPELAQAARLGKQALKDRRIMTLLWRKLQSQNKIAAFLGVNRSSINRRCKEFNLE